MKPTGFIKICSIIFFVICFSFSNASSNCLPEVSATFDENNLSVTANSTKELSNVVLQYNDGSVQKFDDLSGYSQTFEGTGDFDDKCVVGIWIKSGCNSSGDGPGYGEYVENTSWTGICITDLTENVRPVLECVDHNSDGTFTAHFGYLNENDALANIQVGANNKFTPSPIDRGQTIDFLVGRNYDAFQVEFNGSNLVWTLKSPNGSTRTSTASSNPAQKCENDADLCLPESINGGTIAFNGPYNPQGSNVIENVNLPTSTFDGVDFEYIWLQSLENVPNTPGNSSWTVVDGSENLTDLSISGLMETTYYIRCARIVGCDDYWGETNTVPVQVDPCTPANIDGGTIAFSGPYDPQGTNIINNVELPSSPFDGVDFEYVWVQSLVNEPNFVGNPNWSMVEGSQNLTELPVAGLLETTYFIRCARIVGCTSNYWGETNIVEVAVDLCTPESIDGGTIAFNGPYNPQGSNVVENVNLPTSTFDGVDFEYIWLQSLENVPNTPGNSSWTVVDGSENLTVLSISGLLQTTYYIRCARIVGCEDYWGETNTVTVQVDPCTPANIDGGTIAFSGPYDPQETNIINNVELPSSPFDGVDFEYVWVQSLVNEPNFVGNPNWSMVEGSQNLTELPVSGLLETTYFIRCARIVGCTSNYWGETNIVEVAVDLCTPESIDGGTIAFNGPYDPQGSSIVENVELPTSTFDGVDFEYIWLQSLENVPNTPGNSSWTVVDGSENLTDLSISGLIQTTYYIRCARIVGCDDYWGETNTVKVEVFDIPTATLSGGGEFCSGDGGTIQVNFTGNAPFNASYTNGVETFDFTSDDSQITIEVPNGTYNLVSVSDANYSGTVSGSAVVSEIESPSATISGGGTICGEGTAQVLIDLAGTAPFTITYSDGTENTEVTSEENSFTFDATAGSYSLVSVQDANCEGTVTGQATVSQFELPSASIAGGGQICGEGTASVTIDLVGTAPFIVTYSNGNENTEVTVDGNSFAFDATAGSYSLVSVQDANCEGTIEGEASVSQFELPSASIAGGGEICGEGAASVTIDLVGTAPFTVTYTDGTENTEVTVAEDSFTFDATAGSYSLVSVLDANCEGTVAGEASVVQNDLPSATISGGGQICGDGKAPVIIDLVGTAPFTVTYTDGTENTEVAVAENSFTFDAAAGSYSLVSVQDANCEGTIAGEASVSQFELPSASIAGGGQICGEGTALVTIDLVGTAPFTVTYTDGTENTEVAVAENSFTFDATAGSYSLVSVLDANCEGTVAGEASVVQNDLPSATISGGGQICGDGTAPVIIDLVGTAPFTVTYTDGTENTEVAVAENSFTFDAAAGSYSLVSVQDANCEGTIAGEASVSQFELPSASIAGGGQICGEGTASVTIDLVGTAPFTVTYTDGTENTEVAVAENSFIFDATAGSYSLVSVLDANCEGTVAGEASVIQNELPSATISGGGQICGEGTASVTIDLVGTAPFTVTYSNGNENTEVTVDGNSFAFDAAAGSYSLVSMQDANCDGTVNGEAIVDSFSTPTATMSGGGSICQNDEIEITIEFTGVGPWSYEYSKDQTIMSDVSDISTLVISTNEPGSYELLSVSDINCTGSVTGSAQVTSTSLPNGAISINENYCLGDEIMLNNDIDEEGNTFSWTTTGSGNLLNADAKLARYLPIEVENNVQFTLTVSNDCSDTQFSAQTNVIGTSAMFSINPPIENNELLAGVEYEFTAEDNDADRYTWNFSEGLGSSQPQVFRSYKSVGAYTITLSTKKGECSDSYSIVVNVIENDNLFIPNVFSPKSSNPDNSSVKVYGEDLSREGFEFYIYNRWGQVVYKTSNLDDAQTFGWNGETSGEEKGNNVFTYTVRGQYNNGNPFEETGTITLVK